MAETKPRYPPGYGFRGHESLRGVTFPTSLDDLTLPVFFKPQKTPELRWGLNFDPSTDPNTWILGPDGGDKGTYLAVRLVIDGKTYEAGKQFEPSEDPTYANERHSFERGFEKVEELERKLGTLYGKVDVNYPL